MTVTKKVQCNQLQELTTQLTQIHDVTQVHDSQLLVTQVHDLQVTQLHQSQLPITLLLLLLCSFQSLSSVDLARTVVPLLNTITTLGVTLDIQSHITNLCKSHFHHIKAISRIRSGLTKNLSL